jgi:hypothetical protein
MSLQLQRAKQGDWSEHPSGTGADRYPCRAGAEPLKLTSKIVKISIKTKCLVVVKYFFMTPRPATARPHFGHACPAGLTRGDGINKMIKKLASAQPPKRAGLGPALRRFSAGESGSFTIEACVWTPIFAILMAFSTNISMIFFNEAQILRTVQNVARAHSLGRYENDAAAQADLEAQLAYLNANFTASASISGNMVRASITVPAKDLMPVNFMRDPFKNFDLDITAQQLVEY